MKAVHVNNNYCWLVINGHKHILQGNKTKQLVSDLRVLRLILLWVKDFSTIGTAVQSYLLCFCFLFAFLCGAYTYCFQNFTFLFSDLTVLFISCLLGWSGTYVKIGLIMRSNSIFSSFYHFTNNLLLNFECSAYFVVT